MEQEISGISKFPEKRTTSRGEPKFSKRITENFCSIQFWTGIFGNFGRVERAKNTRGNVSKISFSIACYWQVGSKSTNQSPIAWRREGLEGHTSGYNWWISIRSVNDTQVSRRECFVFQSRVSTKTVGLLRNRGVELIFQLPCSPDFNSCEFSFWSMKAYLTRTVLN